VTKKARISKKNPPPTLLTGRLIDKFTDLNGKKTIGEHERIFGWRLIDIYIPFLENTRARIDRFS
jgi:hypothetical protein